MNPEKFLKIILSCNDSNLRIQLLREFYLQYPNQFKKVKKLLIEKINSI